MSEKFTFFWNGPFSNWANSRFEYKGVKFQTAEQAMMWEKACFFSDSEVATKILATNDPSEQKALGRKVRGYDDELWSEVRFDIVTEILRHKFRQHQNSFDALMETRGTTLVEASPFSQIWGIGLRDGDPATYSRDTWQGQNLLGIALTEVRTELENVNG